MTSGAQMIDRSEDEVGSWAPTVEEVRARQMPPTLVFIRVSEGKTVKNRPLDVGPVDGGTDDEVARLLGLGAAKVDVGQGPGSRRLL